MNKYCEICVKPVGEVNKAKILKGTVYLCQSCYGDVKLWREMASKKNNNPVNDIFGSLFKR